MLADVTEEPALPIYWGKNQKGMAAEEELNEEEKAKVLKTILLLRDVSVKMVESLNDIGLHKQTANRYLEPWQHMATVVTATEWANFKALRINKKAQPEFKELAVQMQEAMLKSNPRILHAGEWHTPYVGDEERTRGDNHYAIKLSVARCARVSYKSHETGLVDVPADLSRFDALLASGHMSPFEHQARPLEDPMEWSGNFRGFEQYRKMIPGEAIFDEGEGMTSARLHWSNTKL
jgi:hypothetical protein